jgi:hypothetical protein
LFVKRLANPARASSVILVAREVVDDIDPAEEPPIGPGVEQPSIPPPDAKSRARV